VIFFGKDGVSAKGQGCFDLKSDRFALAYSKKQSAHDWEANEHVRNKATGYLGSQSRRVHGVF
jgi:hypothetical protein